MKFIENLSTDVFGSFGTGFEVLLDPFVSLLDIIKWHLGTFLSEPSKDWIQVFLF